MTVLEDFSGANISGSSECLEEVRLNAFENGYAAGWDDGIAEFKKGIDDTQSHLLEQLRDIDFVAQDIRINAQSAIASFLRDFFAMADSHFPKLMIMTTLSALLNNRDDGTLEISIPTSIDADEIQAICNEANISISVQNGVDEKFRVRFSDGMGIVDPRTLLENISHAISTTPAVSAEKKVAV